MIIQKIHTFWEDTAKVWLHELLEMFRDEGALLFVILLPLAYPLLYSWIYNNEVVREVPVAVVDCSNSATSREFVRHIDASPDVMVAERCTSIDEASRLVGKHKVYGVVYLPSDFDTRLNRMEQAHVSVYCNMGLMLTYKAIFQTCTAVAADMNSGIQIRLSGNKTNREDELTTAPLSITDVPMFNNTSGYGNFILPAVLVLILQQILLLGIGITYGTSYEKNRFLRIRPMLDRRFGAETTSKLSKFAIVSSRMGSSALSSSTATTLPARRQSSWLSAPMPGPISSTPFPSPASLASAMAAGMEASMRKFCPMDLLK